MKVKRLLCVMLTMIMLIGIFPMANKVSAYVAHSQSEAVSWAKSKVGTFVDYDGAYGAQCVDMTMAYYKYLGVPIFYGNAIDYSYNNSAVPTGWKRIEYSNGFVAKPGDIAVFRYGTYGHVGIVISANSSSMSIIHNRNLNGNGVENARNDSYGYTEMNFYCVIRPDFVTCTHSYTSSSPYVCTKCNEWKTDSLKSTKSLSNVQFVITSNDAKDHTGPYGDCKSVNKYSKNTVVTAVQEVVNGYGHTWYKLSNGNYIFSDYVKKYSVSYVNIGTGTYYLKNAATGTYLSVSYGADNNEQPVNLWTSTGDDMKMVIENAPTGYKIRPYISASRLINPFAVSVVHGTKVNLYNNMNDSSQWWQFEKVGSYYVLHNVQNPSCVLDAPGGATSLVYTNNYTGASSQKWTLEPVNAPATYTLDVNGIIDSKSNGWLSNDNGYATFDMYINGSLVKNDVNDYNASHPAGTEYEIKDIKLHGLECYVGVSSGSLLGTINVATTIVLEFRSYHSWDAGTVIREPSATEIGVKLIKCTSCGETKEEILPATGVQRLINIIANIDNSETDVESIAGIGTFDVCINGVVVADDVTEYCKYHPEESKFEIRDIKVSEDKCFAGMYSGKAEYTDGVVSGTLFRDANIRLGFFTYHFGWDKQTTVQATCQNEGMEVHTCVVCGKTKEIKTERTNHDYEMIVKGQPTCTSDGIDVYKCRVCNHEWQNNYGKREHIYTKTIYEATCHEGAYELKVCIDCGDTVKTVISEPSEHEFDVRIDSMPTCHTEGYRMSVCIYCEMQKHETIPMVEHRWDNGTVVKNPTASETGIIAYKCTKCTAEKEEIIPVAEFLPGDVNLDGKITAADARLCLRAAARLDELSGTPRYAADYDNDNQIKAADARLILRKAAKLD